MVRPKIVPKVWPVPFNKCTMACKYANGRSHQSFRNANGVSSNKMKFATISPANQSRNSNVGIGNHLYWLRIARTVAL